MNKILLYNTLGKKIEEFKPYDKNNVKMYTCGPTVYHFAHIGNLRSYLMEDVLERFLNFAGYDVKRAMNITDVGHLANDSDDGEDKMLAGAKREKKTVMQIAEFYTNAFFDDCNKLNIKKPEIVEKATDCVDDYIRLIQQLLRDDYAYIAGGNIYFDTSKLEDYYVLTGHSSDDLAVGVRDNVEEDTNKKNKSDFVLWFTKSKFDSQELKWESPWGVGYPGWHIECTAISLKHLGDNLDIHCGGVDNIFPHHTNEIAQSEAIIGHQWCTNWFHVQHLKMKGGKMSKSSGEFLTLNLLMSKGYNPLAYRMFCLQSHYRKPLDFSYETLDNTVSAYEKLKSKITSLNCDGTADTAKVEEYKTKFIEAVGNDLNTSLGLTVLYDMLKDNLSDVTKFAIATEFDKVLALDLTVKEVAEVDTQLESYVLAKIEERKQAKKDKNFALADEIRQKLLEEKGVELKDTREGVIWTKK